MSICLVHPLPGPKQANLTCAGRHAPHALLLHRGLARYYAPDRLDRPGDNVKLVGSIAIILLLVPD